MRRKALLIAVNRYRDVAGLKGCVNDVTEMHFLLKKFGGLENRDIRVLADSRATKAAIIERLAWLTDGAAPGDLLILHFSGHGSQIRDRDERDELRDGLDELICPYDMDWDDHFLTDDELRRHLQVPPGVSLEVVLDCCNSGDADIAVGTVTTGHAAATTEQTARYLLPPADIVSRHRGDTLTPTRRLFRSRPDTEMVLWSACAADQSAADARIKGVFHGAFTYNLCHHLLAAQGRIARQDLLAEIRESLSDQGFTQVPELAARPDQFAASPFAPWRNP